MFGFKKSHSQSSDADRAQGAEKCRIWPLSGLVLRSAHIHRRPFRDVHRRYEQQPEIGSTADSPEYAG